MSEPRVTFRVAGTDADEVQEILTDAGILFWLEGDD